MKKIRIIIIISLFYLSCNQDPVMDLVNRKMIIPEIISSSIASGEIDVSPKPSILIRYSVSMDSSSVENNLIFEKGASDLVTSKLNWFEDNKVLTVTPEGYLDLNNIYVMKIQKEAVSKDGIPFMSDFSLHFTTTTVDTIPPRIIGSNPIDDEHDVPGGQNIVVYFSEEMDKTSTEASFSLRDKDGNPVIGTIAWPGDEDTGNNLVFTPEVSLKPFEKYTINIMNTTKDSCGNKLLDEFQSNFITNEYCYYIKSIGISSKYDMNPSDVCVTKIGTNQYLHVFDLSSSRVIKYKLNIIAGLPEASYIYLSESMIETRGRGFLGIAKDKDGNTYNLNYSLLYNQCYIVVKDPNGIVIKTINNLSDLFGLAVDNNGIIYSSDANHHVIKKYNSNGEYLGYIGKWDGGVTDGAMKFPADIAINSNNDIYVTDNGNYRIQKFDNTGVYKKKWGTYGTDDEQFRSPIGIAIDNNDNVYITDEFNACIQKFDSDGTFIKRIGSYGTDNGKFIMPWGIDVDDNNNIFIADCRNSNIQKFDCNGNFIVKICISNNSDNAKFSRPGSINFDKDGYLYIVDELNNQIRKLDKEGKSIASWGSWSSPGPGDNQFNQPTDIAISEFNEIYIVDKQNNRIKKIDTDGTLLTKWGTKGTEDGQFNLPEGITIDPYGYVYVADKNNNRIQKFDSNGNFIIKWNYSDWGTHELYFPFCIAYEPKQSQLYVLDCIIGIIKIYDLNGNFQKSWMLFDNENNLIYANKIFIDINGIIYISDPKQHCVHILDIDGNYHKKFGSSEVGVNQLLDPFGVYVDILGYIYVSDESLNVIKIFKRISQ